MSEREASDDLERWRLHVAEVIGSHGMTEKIREWGVTSYGASRFKLIHIDSSEGEDLLEGHIDDDDSKLIAAAPELLEALEMMLDMSEMGEFGKALPEEKAQRAIAKAKGGKV